MKPPSEQRVEEKINEAINRPTSEDDTHPSPIDRFKLAQRVKCDSRPDSSSMVWDLFVDKDGLTNEMSALISRYVAASRGG